MIRDKGWLRSMVAAALLSQAAVGRAQQDDDARAEERRAGVVQLVNRSAQKVTVHFQRYVAADGTTRSLNASLTLGAHRQTSLLLDGAPLRAVRLDYTLETSAGSTAWTITDQSGADDALPVFIDDVHVPFAGTVSGVAGGEEVTTHYFATVGVPQTLVLRAETWSGTPVALQVLDSSGRVVAESTQQSGSSARCMLSTGTQGKYAVRVGGGAEPVRFKLQITAISHGYVLGQAVAQELAKALAGGLIVSALGNERQQQRYVDELKSGAQQDALALAVIEAFVLLQHQVPTVDPLQLAHSPFAEAARGEDDDRFVNVRRAFVDRLLERIHTAAGGS